MKIDNSKWTFFKLIVVGFSGLIISVFGGGVPHFVTGVVSYPGGGHPPAATFTYTAYITLRSSDTQDQNSPNTYTQETGTYTTKVELFTGTWQIGETFHIDIIDGWGGTGTGEVVLTDAAADDLDVTVFGSSLPVQLSGFTAQAEIDGIKLSWITESEVDNAGYYVYRAEDKDGPYVLISGLIQGAGNTSEQSIYEFSDAFAESGMTYYYRLDELDIYGNQTVLSFITATSNYQNPLTFHLHGNYPNPFNSGTLIVYEIPEAGDVRIDIYDTQGRLVRTLLNSFLEKGRQDIFWDGKNVHSNQIGTGTYISVLKYNNQVIMQKMLLVK